VNSFQLQRADTNEPLKIWGCGRCGSIYGAEDVAERCCICIECGKPVGDKPNDFYGNRGYPTHRECRYERDRLREAERMEKAEKVDGWDGWVYCDGCGSNEGYFPSVDEFVEWWEDEHSDNPLPEFVWACKPLRIVPHGDDIMESLLIPWMENGWEGMDESDFTGIDELAKAIEAFSDANKGVVSYSPDCKRAARIGR
jgi:hypothetical protein